MASKTMICEILAKLEFAQEELRKIRPSNDPDMDVTIWNQSPIAKALRRIDETIEMLEEEL